ncbi:hypothetical protein LX32DRAFT_117074 [Colletotrichum zoysiae]|uniref:Uncharacterized protein n=1 Tax=Colletotrichum zoysiae TaxID=1216348 RepID=A0AAD9HPX3_9PEZI|nr:hypothetical protein LX32DRAFT_117074 [Colletotrichum zoysiae]
MVWSSVMLHALFPAPHWVPQMRYQPQPLPHLAPPLKFFRLTLSHLISLYHSGREHIRLRAFAHSQLPPQHVPYPSVHSFISPCWAPLTSHRIVSHNRPQSIPAAQRGTASAIRRRIAAMETIRFPYPVVSRHVNPAHAFPSCQSSIFTRMPPRRLRRLSLNASHRPRTTRR